MTKVLPWLVLVLFLAVSSVLAQDLRAPDWAQVEDETMQHFQALLRFDTSDPPGREQPAADYVRDVLEREGITVNTFALEAQRPNVVARLRAASLRGAAGQAGHARVERKTRCCSWVTRMSSTSTPRSGRSPRSAPRVTAAMSTVGGPSTTRTISRPA